MSIEHETAEDIPPNRERHEGPSPATGDVAALGSVGALVVMIFVVGRGLWFFSDDWNILADYHDGNLLVPFNSHLSLLPAGIYRLLFHTVGLGSYAPYRLVGIAGMVLLGLAVWWYARARIGGWGAALATTAVIWGSGGVTNLMFPFLVNFSLPIAALVGAWILLDRETTRADLGAAAALGVGLATSGLGILAMGAIGVELLLRRAPLRRWIPFAVPVGLWAVWYLTHRISAPGDHALRPMLSYAVRMLWGGTTALAAGWKPGGVVIGVLLVNYFGFAVRARSGRDPRVLGALAAPLLFVGLTAFTRIGVVPAIPPDEFRYRWTIAAFLVLAVVSAWPRDLPQLPLPEGASRLVRRIGAGVAVTLVLLGAIAVTRDSSEWSDTVEAAAPGLAAELFAAEAVGDRVDPSHVLPLSYVPVTLGAYLQAVADVGSPLDGHPANTFGGSRDHRASADLLLARLPARPGNEAPEGCDMGHGTTLSLPPGGTVVVSRSTGRPPVVRMARFGDEFHVVDWVMPVGEVWQVRVPNDARRRSGAPAYRLRIEGTAGDIPSPVVCAP